MNILIVDDQPSVISALKSGIHWSSLGIDKVFTAGSAQDAKVIIAGAESIDILLSDIEMPVENGLSLLHWCRENHYDFECIFLTSHADFFYAQEALQLGSTDYILQPARYEEVEAVIRKTIQKIEKKQSEENLFSFGKTVFSHKELFLENILKDWFEAPNEDSAKKLNLLHDMGFSLTPDTNIFLLKLQVLSWTEEPLSFSAWSESVSNKMAEHFQYNHLTMLCYFPDHLTLQALIYQNRDTEPLSFSQYQTCLNLLTTKLERQFPFRIALYTTPALPFAQLASGVQAIQSLSTDNILLKPGIYFPKPQTSEISAVYCDSKLLESFHLLFINYNTKQISDTVANYLLELSEQHQLNQQTLLEFCRDFEQTAITSAAELGLDIHDFPTRKKGTSIDSFFPLTLQSAKQFIETILSYFDSVKISSETESCLQKITNYIRANMDKPIKCSDIAQAVYLSPGYITRLLQKEKGISLKEYILLEKMSMAQNLLKNTQFSISSIAISVGYDNFSHFSQLYKKTYGISPSEERSNVK